jgi:hypothetical protein
MRTLKAWVSVIAVGVAGLFAGSAKGNIVFNFENLPAGSALPDTFPTSLLQGGVHAIISSSPFPTAYSIQDAATALGKVPTGFSGNAIIANRTDGASDLGFMFDKVLTSFSIQIATDEINLTSSSTITANEFLFVSPTHSYTYSNTPGGTWPSGTFSFTDPAGFTQVVLHYSAVPPTGTAGTFVKAFAVDNLVVDVPEPASVGVLAIFGVLMLRRGRAQGVA